MSSNGYFRSTNRFQISESIWTMQVCYSVQDSYEFHTIHLATDNIYNPHRRHKQLMLDTFLQTDD
jgi:hypothetical protein